MEEVRGKYVSPAIDQLAFNCPHCDALARQFWFSVHADPLKSDEKPVVATAETVKTLTFGDIEEAEQLLSVIGENKEIIDICRMLIKRELTWKTLRETLKAMPSPDAESIRIVISCYLAGCVMGARDERDIADLCELAYRFSKPFNPSDKLMPLFLAFDEVMR